MNTEASSPSVAPSARALWIVGPQQAEVRDTPLPDRGPGDVLVRAICSGISRGTESLVYRGAVPESEYARMRAPHQSGSFPGPVKYGYASVGRVEQGPDDLVGRDVFALYPHQEAYLLSRDHVVPIPEGIPAQRAILAANMETAVNAVWDAMPSVGDRIAVIGAGVVGCLVAFLAAKIPGCEVDVYDLDPRKARPVEAMGGRFRNYAMPEALYDLVFEATGHPDGLRQGLRRTVPDGTIVAMSWYGTADVSLPLGTDFHVRRIRIVSSQVGSLPPHRRARWDHRRRLTLAIALLDDPTLDVLLTGETPLAELPSALPAIFGPDALTLCHRVTYPTS